MSPLECLRQFVNERLTAAAEEIFRVFQQKIDEYEEEIDRQRKMLDVVLGPEVKFYRIDCPQQLVCKEEEVLTDQQLCNHERNSSLDGEEAEPPQIKEEQEELCSCQKEEQLVVKQHTDTFMLTLNDEEYDHREDQTVDCNPDETLEEPVVHMPVVTSVVSDPHDDLQLLSNSSHVTVIKDEKGDKHEDSGSTRDEAEKEKDQQHKNTSCTKNVHNLNKLKTDGKSDIGKNSFVCSTCGKHFNLKSTLQIHMRVHTGERLYICKTCGKSFKNLTHLLRHKITHTAEKPHTCMTCGKAFKQSSSLQRHGKIHTGMNSHICNTCGKTFASPSALIYHMRIHTGEKPHICLTCGKAFTLSCNLVRHRRIHTGEKPHTCTTCGKAFIRSSELLYHRRIHTGEKPHICVTCGKAFTQASTLFRHRKIHTGVKPHICKTCGKAFTELSGLVRHRRIHTDENPHV